MQKIKNFFKKYWSYFVTFGLGLVTYLGIDRARGTRIDRDISRLKTELREYAIRIEQLEHLNSQLRREAQILDQNNDELDRSIQELDGISRESREHLRRTETALDELQISVSELGEDTNGLRDVENRLREQSESVEQGINRLGAFIEKYSSKTDGN